MKRQARKVLSVALSLTIFSGAIIAQNEVGLKSTLEDTCGFTMGANYICIEAENTSSPLGKWQIITKDDARYYDADPIKPINGTHLEFTGNDHNSGPATSPLEYKFIAPKTGKYRLAMRLYQRLEGQPEDKCNDVFVKMAGDFTSGNTSYTTADLKTNLKFFGRGVNKWGTSYNGDGGSNHAKAAILYNLTKGKEYTFTMSGRAQRTNIDYILFYETSLALTVKSKLDLAKENDEKYRPMDCSDTTTVVNPSNIKAYSKDKTSITVSPNPVIQGMFKILFSETAEEKKDIEIISISGKSVYKTTVYKNVAEFSSDILPSSGLYFIKLRTNNKSYVQKFIMN